MRLMRRGIMQARAYAHHWVKSCFGRARESDLAVAELDGWKKTGRISGDLAGSDRKYTGK